MDGHYHTEDTFFRPGQCLFDVQVTKIKHEILSFCDNRLR
jgi:hypothetical protein